MPRLLCWNRNPKRTCCVIAYKKRNVAMHLFCNSLLEGRNAKCKLHYFLIKISLKTLTTRVKQIWLVNSWTKIDKSSAKMIGLSIISGLSTLSTISKFKCNLPTATQNGKIVS